MVACPVLVAGASFTVLSEAPSRSAGSPNVRTARGGEMQSWKNISNWDAAQNCSGPGSGLDVEKRLFELEQAYHAGNVLALADPDNVPATVTSE